MRLISVVKHASSLYALTNRCYVIQIAFSLLIFLGAINNSGGAEQEETRETSRLLAILFDSGRVVVGLNQDLINDPSKGDKGFTAEVFEKQVLTLFEQRTGIDLSGARGKVSTMAQPLLARLLEESKKTIASYQTPINISGIRYKGLIPATFGTETAARFQTWSGIYLRQVAPEHFLRNPKNKPDAYESDILKTFPQNAFTTGEPAPNWEVTEAGKALRLMLPLYYTKACLGCHGEPKGERDISGYPREGGKEGDLGGAISVKLPLK
jgi:hypothetical protein